METSEMIIKLENVTLYENTKESLLHCFQKERYIIIGESVSGHCCFKYTIVDAFGGNDGEYWDWECNRCECFNLNDAIAICYALNTIK